MSKLEQNKWDLLLQRIRDPSNARRIMFEAYVLNIFKHGGNFEIKCLQGTEVRSHTIIFNIDKEKINLSFFLVYYQNKEQQLTILEFKEYKYMNSRKPVKI